MSLVSVIMPAYNAEKYIGKAIESILNQTYDNLELIIIDDNSEDNTVNVIQAYSSKKIRFFKNEINMGISYSTNFGIKQAAGKYIALQDDDDISEIDRIEKQVLFLDNHYDIDVLGGGCVFIDGNDVFIKAGVTPRNNPNYIRAMLLFNNLDFVNTSMMCRKDFLVVNNLWYEEACYGMQDYLFYIKASKVGRISSVPDIIVKCRLHDKNSTNLYFTNHEEERANKYMEFRKYSLNESGFLLSKKDMYFLNRVLAEKNKQINGYEEWIHMKEIFKSLLSQARDNNVDYYDELLIVEKKLLAKLLVVFNCIDGC